MLKQRLFLSLLVMGCLVIWPSGAPLAELDWDVVWDCNQKPSPKDGWELVNENLADFLKYENGVAHVKTPLASAGDILFRNNWEIDKSKGAVIAIRLKVVSNGPSRHGIALVIGFGINGEFLCFQEDQIAPLNVPPWLTDAETPPYKMDTTDDFHTYLIVKTIKDMRVYLADNPRHPKLILDGTGKLKSGYDLFSLDFGDETSGASGEYYLDFIKFKEGADVDITRVFLAVKSTGKLATAWGRLKSF